MNNQNNRHLRCLSFNAQSIRSTRKLPDGSYASNLKSFQDLVYAEELDLIFVTESRLNDNFSDKEILPKGYNIVRKDRSANQRGGGVFIALRVDVPYTRITAGRNGPNWSDRLEIVAIELDMSTCKKCLACVCYRPPSCDSHEWLALFTAFLETTANYEKVLIVISSEMHCYTTRTQPLMSLEVRVNYREGGLYVIYSPEDAQRPRAVYHIQPNFEVIN